MNVTPPPTHTHTHPLTRSPARSTGKWCGLRDFPPLPDGYGASRLYCPFNAYDHNWMWRVYKVGDRGTGDHGGGKTETPKPHNHSGHQLLRHSPGTVLFPRHHSFITPYAPNPKQTNHTPKAPTQ